MTTLSVNADGRLYGQSQVEDYVGRGKELENFNVLDYFIETYEIDGAKSSDEH
jgi:hypothetical protein